jgi:hypothetical protein
MMRWNQLRRRLPFRRRQTLADRVQDVAEDVVDRVQDVAEDVVDRAAVTARGAYGTVRRAVRPGHARHRRWPLAAGRIVASPPVLTAGRALASPPVLTGLARGVTELTADRAAGRARETLAETRERLTPVLKQSGEVVEAARARTLGTAAAGLTAASLAGRGAATAAAATGEVTVGFFAGLGRALGSLLRRLWSLTVFLVKAAILAGVAYAGWEWLQSRRRHQYWSSPEQARPAGSTSETTFAAPAGAVG